MASQIKVLLSRFFYKSDLDFISRHVPDVIFLNENQFDDESLIDACKGGVDVVLGPPPNKKVLGEIHNKLSFIQIPWTGVENICFESCARYSIKVSNSHGNAQAVAEMALSLLMSLLKSIPYHDIELRKGNWHRPGDEEGFFPPVLLQGKTIGYFGFGHINKSLDRMLAGFKLDRIAYVAKAKEIREDGMVFFTGQDFHKFLKNSDIIIIGAPLTEDTINKFDYDSFSKMKCTSIIINVSRGAIVNESDLYSALSNKQIAGAALDTWYKYPSRGYSKTSPSNLDFSKFNNLVMSPHRSGFVANDFPHLHDVIKNLKSHQRGGKLINLINYQEGY